MIIEFGLASSPQNNCWSFSTDIYSVNQRD